MLSINNVKYDVETSKSYLLDEKLYIECSDITKSLILTWEDYHYRLYIDGVLLEVECLYTIHKYIWDLKYKKIKSLIIKYITSDQINQYRKYIYN